jgi:uncharacterized protein YdaU (DUF1376 family)
MMEPLMNYVQFHIGDWESGTRLLTPLEKGIYIDLLMLYYSTERPILRSYFDRITRGYTEDERKAFDYVVSQYFEEQDDGFHNARCDEEIAKAAEKSEKARKSIQARWNKAAKGSASSVSDTCRKPDESTGAIRTNNERNTDVLLTKNQEPITNINKKEEGTCVCASEEDDSFCLDSEEEKPQTTSKRKTPEAATHPFDLQDLPDDWREYCREVRPDLDPDRMFSEFKFYWQKGNGKGKLRSDKGWAQSWQNWIRSDKSKPATATFVNRRPQTSSLPVPDCNEIDYHRGINPDGSF